VEEPIQEPSIPEPIEEPIQEPSIPEPIEEPIQESPIPEPVEEPIQESPIPEPVEEPIQKTPIPEPVKEPVQESSISTNKNLSKKDVIIANQFDTLLTNLNNLTGAEISSILNNVRDDITESRGYTGVLRPISLTISSLRFNSNILSGIEIDQIKNKIEFWREKLNL
ncbi:MAG: hypothetical protein ACTSQD_05535, partial [Promethearchaeota archaeon]